MEYSGFRRHVLASAAFAIGLAVTVIAVAGYYDTPLLLVAQLLLIGGPTLIAFLPLPRDGRLAIPGWLAIAVLMIAGWGYVVYVDTRPYQGGGASFAMLFGWMTCVIAIVMAKTIALLNRRFDR